MKAVVVHELDKLEVQEVTLDLPKAGEVKVKMAAGVNARGVLVFD